MSLVSQRNLAGGELAPALYPRVDTVKYVTGVKTARNFFILKSGGMVNRSGTKFTGEVKDSSARVRLIPFIFNNDQTYVLEFGNEYMRVIRNGEYVLDGTSSSVEGVSTAAEAVFTITGHSFTDGDEIYLAGVVGITGINGANYRISDSDTNTFKLKHLDGSYLSTAGLGTYSSGGTVTPIYEIATDFTTAQLEFIQYAQSGDIITMVDGTVWPQDLSRTDHDAWTMADKILEPIIASPANVTYNDGASGSQIYPYGYRVTAISADTYEEGFAGISSIFSGIYEPTASQPHAVSWDAVTGAAYYNVYVVRAGLVGFLGISTGTTFSNTGISPDFGKTPPIDDQLFDGPSEDYIQPTCVNYAQQRLILGGNNYSNSPDQPEEIRMSRTGLFNNFTSSIPRQDDDSIRIRMAGRQINQIRHILDLNKLVVMTTGGEFTIESTTGALTSTDIGLKQYSYNGSSRRTPIVIDSTALYVQERGSIVRDLGYDYAVDGYKGNDLTVFSTHLFDGYEIVDWGYQKTPNSIVWAVRDDGVLLSLTYVREHQIWGWTKHDTDGLVENVCVIPEGSEDSVYLVVKRTIDGRTVRYVERFNTRFINDAKDMIFMDSTLSYDGRNTGSDTLKLQLLGGAWLKDETLALVSSATPFTAANVGNKYHLTGADGSLIIVEATGYFDSSTLYVRPDKDVPTSLRNITTTIWTRAVKNISGLRHLEGKDVSVLGDGFVIGSPNNADVTTITVADGAIELDDCYGVIHIGLPYISDIESLNIDTVNGESLVDKQMLINKVFIHVDKTRGLFVGTKPPSDDSVDPIEDLMEIKVRDAEYYDDPVQLLTGVMDAVTDATWNNNGRVFIRQIDPLPATILGISPAGEIPFR